MKIESETDYENAVARWCKIVEAEGFDDDARRVGWDEYNEILSAIAAYKARKRPDNIDMSRKEPNPPPTGPKPEPPPPPPRPVNKES